MRTLEARTRRQTHSRAHIHAPAGVGERAADAITTFVGSWAFVGIHASWFVLWILLRFEPFPFGLLTLLVSLEAIFLSTFVMMSQNRAAQKDHLRDDHEADEVDQLFTINQQQLEILTEMRELRALVKADSADTQPMDTKPLPAVPRRRRKVARST